MSAAADLPNSETFEIGSRSGGAPPLAPGTQIGEYQVLDLLGQGAMGTVFRVRHQILGTEYALKMVGGEGQTQLREQRFLREAQATAQIIHPNVVRLHYSGLTADGRAYLVMELLEGRPLSALVGQGPLSADRAARIIRQVAAGLAEIHRLGFVHRDIKPSNLMVLGDGDAEVVKILDLGLVGYRESSEMVRLTQHGHLMGTPLYMAPEALSSGTFSAQTDLYALGALLYELLSGKPPFDGSLKEIFWHHHVTPPPPLPSSHGLDELAFWLLAKAPDRRPTSAEVVIEQIDRRMATSAVAQRIEAAPRRLVRSISRRLAKGPEPGPDWPVVIAVGATALTLIALLFWARFGAQASVAESIVERPPPNVARAPVIAPPPAVPASEPPVPIPPPLLLARPPPVKVASGQKRAFDKARRVTEGPREVTITSSPSGAIVETEGGRLGLTPLSAAVERGKTVVFRVHKDGFVDQRVSLSSKSPKKKLHVSLEPQGGSTR